MSRTEIVLVAVAIAALILLVVCVSAAKSEDCDTMLCGWCQEYPDICNLYPEPTDGIVNKYKREYLPIVHANAFLPTPAPTQNPFPTITYPAPAPTPTP